MDLSEFELIDRIAARARDAARIETGIGDDCAVVRGRGRVVTTVDTAVAGVHFQPGRPTAESAWKAVAGAVSDVAAMGIGGVDIDLLVALGVPAGTSSGDLQGLVDGVAGAAAEFDAELIGGDIVSAPVLFLSVTVVAHVDDSTPLVTRSGARAGDVVAVTGPVGGAAAGLRLVEGAEVSGLSDLSRQLLVECQVRPRPELAAAPVLARAGASAMIDVSDGLAADLAHVAEASRAALRIEGASIPTAAGSAEVFGAADLDPFEAAVTGGEDYVLALTIPEERFEAADTALIEATGFELLAIGAVEAPSPGRPAVTFELDGETRSFAAGGHDHFRPGSPPR